MSEINKYSTGKIYKIWSPSHDDFVYYGSTIEKLNRRLSGHRNKYTSHKAGKCGNCTSFKIFDECDDYRIDLVENYPCNNKEELNSREGYYIKNNTCVNKHIAGRTQKEYREDNKDKVKARHKQYNEDNKDKVNARHKQYRENNKDKIKDKNKQYNELNKEQSKQYREDNRDKIKKQQKQWWDLNKDKINAKRKELRLLK